MTDGQTDRETDGQTDGIAIASTVLAMRALRCAVKKEELLTDLDASLPLEVDAPQFGVVVNGGDV